MNNLTGVITGAFTSPYCFVAGTAILTGAGYVAIEYIKKGDLVWSSNPDTGETALKEVLQTYVNETDELILKIRLRSLNIDYNVEMK